MCYDRVKSDFVIITSSLERKKEKEYLKYLKIAVERNSDEAFMTLHHLFPEGMTPEEYYDYAIKKTNNN